MFSRGDDVKILPGAPVARLERHGDQVLAEVAGGGVDGEALARRGFDGGRGEGAGGGVVTRVRFGGGGGVEGGAGAEDGGAVGEGDDGGGILAREEVGLGFWEEGESGGYGKEGSEKEQRGGGGGGREMHCALESKEHLNRVVLDD